MYGDHIERKNPATDDLRLKIYSVPPFDTFFYNPLQGVVLHRMLLAK
jgi:hypothetical protein